MAECSVPPENVPPRADVARQARSGHRSGSCATVNSAPRSCGIESNPQECTSRAPVCARLLVVAQATSGRRTRARRSGRRSRARGGAGRDERLAVADVRADRADHDPGGRRERRGSSRRPRRRPGAAAATRRRARRPRAAPAPPRACASLRPASAQRVPAPACAARYSAVSPPVNPVAPNSTMS